LPPHETLFDNSMTDQPLEYTIKHLDDSVFPTSIPLVEHQYLCVAWHRGPHSGELRADPSGYAMSSYIFLAPRFHPVSLIISNGNCQETLICFCRAVVHNAKSISTFSGQNGFYRQVDLLRLAPPSLHS
jgi:hypothetical protein